MQIFSTVTALAFLASAVNALQIVSPVANQVLSSNLVTVQVNNDVGETFTSVQVVFASACGSFTRAIPTNNAQQIVLPCNVAGPTQITASYSSGVSASIQVSISPAGPYGPSPYGPGCALPYGPGCINPCADPCASPCANPCANPCASRRSRRSAAAPCLQPYNGVCNQVATATPCDTLYFNPPANFPLPDCARNSRCSRRRLYGDDAEAVQAFEEFQQLAQQQQIAAGAGEEVVAEEQVQA